MSTDESSSGAATREESSDAKKGKRASSAPASKEGATSVAAPLDEEKINAPSRQDLVMLGVICFSTLILWAAGRAACNYQVPGESLTPRKVSLEERTRTPKDVGIEIAQAMSGGNFEIAGQLARGEAAAIIKKDQAACGACTQRKNVADKLLSVGTVLQSNSVDSIVSVKTIGGGVDTTRVFGVERDGRKWFVTRIYDSAADAKLKEDPTRTEAPPSITRPEEDAAAPQVGATEQQPEAVRPEPDAGVSPSKDPATP